LLTSCSSLPFVQRPHAREQLIIGGEGENNSTLPEVDFKAVVGYAAPIGEIPTGKGGRALVHLRSDRACQKRVPAIGTNCDLRAFSYDGAAPIVSPADTHQPIVLGKKILDKESVSQLCASINSSIDRNTKRNNPSRWRSFNAFSA
jgi:hypothetical protein